MMTKRRRLEEEVHTGRGEKNDNGGGTERKMTYLLMKNQASSVKSLLNSSTSLGVTGNSYLKHTFKRDIVVFICSLFSIDSSWVYPLV